MKTNLKKRFAGILLALTVTAASAVSANNFDGKGRNQTSGVPCLNQISGLTQDQKTQITALETSHQTTMNEFREKRRATTDVAQKDQIRTEMLAQVTAHRNAVKAILTPDQQKQFDRIPRNSGNQRAGFGQGKQARGSGKCNGQGNGSGRKCR